MTPSQSPESIENEVTGPRPRFYGTRFAYVASAKRIEDRRAFAAVLSQRGIQVTVGLLDDLVEVLRDRQPKKWNGLGRVQRRKLFIQERGLCFRCRKRCTIGWFTVEHKVDRADGGSDEWENLTISHPECNREWGEKTAAGRLGSTEGVDIIS